MPLLLTISNDRNKYKITNTGIEKQPFSKDFFMNSFDAGLVKLYSIGDKYRVQQKMLNVV